MMHNLFLGKYATWSEMRDQWSLAELVRNSLAVDVQNAANRKA